MVTSVSKLEKHIPDWDTNPYSNDAKAQRWKHITCIGKGDICVQGITRSIVPLCCPFYNNVTF